MADPLLKADSAKDNLLDQFADQQERISILETYPNVPDEADSLYCNVKDYGATGDGQTDDTTAIQSAIDQAESSDINTVIFPPGTYEISSSLIMDEPCRMIGFGKDTMIEATANITMIKMENNSEVRDIRLIGYNRASSSSIGIQIGGNASYTNVQAVIKNVWLESGFYYGVYCLNWECDHTLIEHLKSFSKLTKAAIYINSGTAIRTAGLIIRRCHLSGSQIIGGETNYGIYLRGVEECILEANIVNSFDTCIRLDGTIDSGLWNVILSGTHTEESRTGIATGSGVRWSATAGISTDDMILPTKDNATGFVYIAQGNGTTGGTEPTWPTSYGGTVVDNTVTWEAHAQSISLYIGAYIREMQINGYLEDDCIYGIVDNSQARIDAHLLHFSQNDFGLIRQIGGPSYWSMSNSSLGGNFKPYITTHGSATDSMFIFKNIIWGLDNLGYAPTEHALISDLDIYTVPWTPYQNTSTIVGWASYTTKVIEYKKIGKLVFVNFTISGTSGGSDGTVATFTLPFSHAHGTGNNPSFKPAKAKNSGSNLAGAGWGRVITATATFYTTESEAGWTATGGKVIIGQFWYEAAS